MGSQPVRVVSSLRVCNKQFYRKIVHTEDTLENVTLTENASCVKQMLERMGIIGIIRTVWPLLVALYGIRVSLCHVAIVGDRHDKQGPVLTPGNTRGKQADLGIFYTPVIFLSKFNHKFKTPTVPSSFVWVENRPGTCQELKRTL